MSIIRASTQTLRQLLVGNKRGYHSCTHVPQPPYKIDTHIPHPQYKMTQQTDKVDESSSAGTEQDKRVGYTSSSGSFWSGSLNILNTTNGLL